MGLLPTGFAQGPLQLLIFTSITRITLQVRNPGRHDHGQRDRADEMACYRAWRARRRIPVRLHVVLTDGSHRRAAVGMAIALLARDPARSPGSLGPAWRQGEPTFRACHYGNGEGRTEEAARHLVAGARVPARDANRDLAVLLLPVHLDRLVCVDAAIPRQRKASRLYDHSELSFDLDVLRDLRLLPLRLALRPLWPPLRHTRLRPPGFDPPHRFGISGRSVKPVLGRIGFEFPDHGELRRRPGVQHRTVPDPDPRGG